MLSVRCAQFEIVGREMLERISFPTFKKKREMFILPIDKSGAIFEIEAIITSVVESYKTNSVNNIHL